MIAGNARRALPKVGLKSRLARIQVSSYLTSRDELQWPQPAAEVGSVSLEVVQRIGDAGLRLVRVLPRWAIRSNLVQSLIRSHDC